jgi:hypothetical protein
LTIFEWEALPVVDDDSDDAIDVDLTEVSGLHEREPNTGLVVDAAMARLTEPHYADSDVSELTLVADQVAFVLATRPEWGPEALKLALALRDAADAVHASKYGQRCDHSQPIEMHPGAEDNGQYTELVL